MRTKNYENPDAVPNTETTTAPTTDDLTTKGAKEGSNGIWNTLLSNAGGIFSGIGDVVGSFTGKGGDTVNNYNEQKKTNNSGTYLAIGGIALVVILILVFALKK